MFSLFNITSSEDQILFVKSDQIFTSINLLITIRFELLTSCQPHREIFFNLKLARSLHPLQCGDELQRLESISDYNCNV